MRGQTIGGIARQEFWQIMSHEQSSYVCGHGSLSGSPYKSRVSLVCEGPHSSTGPKKSLSPWHGTLVELQVVHEAYLLRRMLQAQPGKLDGALGWGCHQICLHPDSPRGDLGLGSMCANLAKAFGLESSGCPGRLAQLPSAWGPKQSTILWVPLRGSQHGRANGSTPWLQRWCTRQLSATVTYPVSTWSRLRWSPGIKHCFCHIFFLKCHFYSYRLSGTVSNSGWGGGWGVGGDDYKRSLRFFSWLRKDFC